MPDRSYEPERLATLFHYVISRIGGRAGFGATKLYKIAWFSDARQFMLTGQSITGAEYIKEEFGPIPKMARAIRSSLVASGSIKEWRDSQLFGEPWKFKALTQPNINLFSSEERAIIDFWIKNIDEQHTATSISELSHDYGWEIVGLKEHLPFSAFFADRIREPNEVESSWVKKRVSELGLK